MKKGRGLCYKCSNVVTRLVSEVGGEEIIGCRIEENANCGENCPLVPDVHKDKVVSAKYLK